jgi:hypothetical protein
MSVGAEGGLHGGRHCAPAAQTLTVGSSHVDVDAEKARFFIPLPGAPKCRGLLKV